MSLDNTILNKISNFKKFIISIIPIGTLNTPLSDTTDGSVGSSLEYARSDHRHPISSLYATSGHNHNDTYVDTVTDNLSSSSHGTQLCEIKANTTTVGSIYHPKVLGSAVSSGLYKITVNTDGHITATASVGSSDLPSHSHSEYLTSHQDISGKLDISQTNYKGKNVVVDNTTGNITFENKPTVPQASTSSPLVDVTGGAIGSDSKYAKADHQHPLSSDYAAAGHTHSGYLTSTDISNMEVTTNRVTAISSNSTDNQYPTALAVYTYINTIVGNIEGDLLS